MLLKMQVYCDIKPCQLDDSYRGFWGGACFQNFGKYLPADIA
jgi:hypothetical protein